MDILKENLDPNITYTKADLTAIWEQNQGTDLGNALVWLENNVVYPEDSSTFTLNTAQLDLTDFAAQTVPASTTTPQQDDAIISGYVAAKVMRDLLPFTPEKDTFTLDEIKAIALDPNTDPRLKNAINWFLANGNDYTDMERTKRSDGDFNINNLKSYINRNTGNNIPETNADSPVNDSHDAAAILLKSADWGKDKTISYATVTDWAATATDPKFKEACQYFVDHHDEFSNMETDFGREGVAEDESQQLLSRDNALNYYNRNNVANQKIAY